MENVNEIINILKTLGITTLLTLLLGWIGKRYLDKKLEQEKASNQSKLKDIESTFSKNLEIHKQKEKKFRDIFQ